MSSDLMIYDTFGDLYQQALGMILDYGQESSPRGMKTKEVLAAQLILTDAQNCLVDSEARNLNYRFAVAEWLWIMAGHQDVDSIARYNKEIAKFSDDGQIFNGAYGPRLISQWEYVVRALQKPDSRQAVATIWSPCPKDSKDVPCTISLQFLVRQGKLHTICTMRSSDAWLGLPYDVHNFAQTGNWLAGLLGVGVGSITMQLGSLHLYEPNWEKAEELIRENVGTIRVPALPGFPLHSSTPDFSRSAMDSAVRLTFDSLFFNHYLTPWPEPWATYRRVLDAPTRKEARDVLKSGRDR